MWQNLVCRCKGRAHEYIRWRISLSHPLNTLAVSPLALLGFAWCCSVAAHTVLLSIQPLSVVLATVGPVPQKSKSGAINRWINSLTSRKCPSLPFCRHCILLRTCDHQATRRYRVRPFYYSSTSRGILFHQTICTHLVPENNVRFDRLDSV